MPVDTPTNEVERIPYSSTTESLRVRCPSCRKLYLVKYADIQEAKPRFECVQCHSRFWLPLADIDLNGEVSGIPIQLRESPLALRSRPVEHKEPESTPAHSRTLEQLWRRVIADYPNRELHSEFIRACQRERNLGYAGAQYSQMRKLMPTDEETGRRLKEIQALGSVAMSSVLEKAARRVYPRLWQVPLLVSTIMIVIGSALPVFRNMIGVGAAILFVGVAMHLHFRGRM
jgi:hypothetical protein